MTESWLPVVGFEGAYEVSDYGRVRSIARPRLTPRGDTYAHKGRVLRPVPRSCRGNHLWVCLSFNGRRWQPWVHRLVLEAFVGPCPEGMECCHNDGDPTNNRLENLRWDTRVSNMADKLRHGTSPAFRTHCKNGHEYTAENTHWVQPAHMTRKARKCRKCEVIYMRNARARKRLALATVASQLDPK